MAELLARPPNRRCVDDRKVLLDVLDEEAIEERRVPVLEGGQPDVALQVVRLPAEVLVLQGELLLDRENAIREDPVQPEGVPLIERKRKLLGQESMVEEFAAGNCDVHRESGAEAIERCR